MITILFILAYILAGSIVTVLAFYVSETNLLDDECSYILAVWLWPLISLPVLLVGVIKKVFDKINKTKKQ